MDFRKSKREDIEKIMMVIKKAQAYLKEQGIDQWQNGYPNEDVIKTDIDNDESYVLVDGKKVIGTTALSFDGENTYNSIYEGEWLTNGDHAVIHRIAIDSDFKRKGLASKILKEVDKECEKKKIESIKIDTHRENMAMQNLLMKNGFKYCGIIYLNDGNERIAFEKVLEKGL